MSFAFEDLTTFDRFLIKSNAGQALALTKVSDRYQALVDAVLVCIHARGFNIDVDAKDLIKNIMPTGYFREIPVGKPADQLIEDIFKYFKTNNIEIVKDETREATWNQPSKSWYITHDNTKKDWIY